METGFPNWNRLIRDILLKYHQVNVKIITYNTKQTRLTHYT